MTPQIHFKIRLIDDSYNLHSLCPFSCACLFVQVCMSRKDCDVVGEKVLMLCRLATA